MTTAPLDGVRVLDLSRVLAGPFAAQMLGDLGAEVIKVERPGAGDDTRGWGPPFLQKDGETGDAAYYLSANRNKRSIAVDIASEEGRVLVQDLSAKADVVIENFKTGGLEKYGLDYASVKARNPGVIYCSITGFGHTGPQAGRAGYDFMIQGMSGLMSVTGEPDGEPEKVGVAVSDLFTALHASTSICAALTAREKTGQGAHIDLALFDCQLAAMVNQAANYLISGTPPGRLGAAHPNIVPYSRMPSADGYFILAVGNDGQFRRFCQVAGHEDWADDPRFATNRDRVANREALHALIEPMTRQRASSEWLKELEAVGVPCGPINDVGQAFDEPTAKARGLKETVQHAFAGPLQIAGSPLWLDGAHLGARLAPPVLGQHTDEILGELGLDADRIAALRQSGAVA